jgi:lysophospholipase L1-like esterase
MEANTEKVKQTKKLQLLAVFAVILIISSGLIALYFENFGNSPHVGSVTRVACVGDSITEGFGYPDKLEKMLGNNYTVGNFGVGGSTVLLSSGKSYINQSVMQRAKEYQPDIVVIMLGTNDAVPAYYQHIEKFVNDYKTLIWRV